MSAYPAIPPLPFPRQKTLTGIQPTHSIITVIGTATNLDAFHFLCSQGFFPFTVQYFQLHDLLNQ